MNYDDFEGKKAEDIAHPAANVFPMMSDAELRELGEDIKANRLRTGIVIDAESETILDGRNRFAACQLVGVKPWFVLQHHPGGESSRIAYVLSCNLHRRHLTTSQRAMVAARMNELHEAAAVARMKGGKKADPGANLHEGGRATEHAARALGVSARSVSHAKTVIDSGSPELIEMCDAGKVAVSRAAPIAKTTPKPKQAEAAKANCQPAPKAVHAEPSDEDEASASEVEYAKFAIDAVEIGLGSAVEEIGASDLGAVVAGAAVVLRKFEQNRTYRWPYANKWDKTPGRPPELRAVCDRMMDYEVRIGEVREAIETMLDEAEYDEAEKSGCLRVLPPV